MAIDINELLEMIESDPELTEIEFATKEVICKKFSMKAPTLTAWLSDIRDNYPVKHTVINPGGLCLIDVNKFRDYLIWKSDNKNKARKTL